MLIEFNPDDYVVVTSHHTCPFHLRNPGTPSYAGCTCSASHGLIRKRSVSHYEPVDREMLDFLHRINPPPEDGDAVQN